jgi:hypothetical protein
MSSIKILPTLNNDSEVSWVGIGRIPGMNKYTEAPKQTWWKPLAIQRKLKQPACPGPFKATDGSQGKEEAGTVAEVLEIPDLDQLRV